METRLASVKYSGPDGFDGAPMEKTVSIIKLDDSCLTSSDWAVLIFKLIQFRDVRTCTHLGIIANILQLFAEYHDDDALSKHEQALVDAVDTFCHSDD